jgi:hypothetical protein
VDGELPAYRCGSKMATVARPAEVDASAPDTPEKWCVGVQWILGIVTRERGAEGPR